jgi:hypothetical protein
MATKYFSHQVSIPALTDVPEMMGAYLSLFLQIGIKATMPFEPQACFTHPIEHENTKLTNEFFSTMNLLSIMGMNHGELTLTDTRMHGSQVVFVFSYNE